MGTFCRVCCVISLGKTLDRWLSSLRRAGFRRILLVNFKTDLFPKKSIYAQFKSLRRFFCLLRTLAGNVKIIITENWFVINYFNFLGFGNGNLFFYSSIPKPHLIGIRRYLKSTSVPACEIFSVLFQGPAV